MNSSNSNSKTLRDLHQRNPGLATKTYHFIAPNPSYRSDNRKALKRIENAAREGIDDLDLSGLSLKSLPDELFALSRLRTLNLSKNQLTDIPEQIRGLRELRTLVADENPLTTIHKNIGELQNLITLSLINCQLKEFPQGILAIHSLKSLQLEGNNIPEIPVGLKDMEIEEINLVGNPIRDLPEEFFNTTSARLFHYYNDREQNTDTRNFTA